MALLLLYKIVNTKETFITDKSDDRLRKMARVYTIFNKRFPELTIEAVDIDGNKAIVTASDLEGESKKYEVNVSIKDGNIDKLRKMSCVYNRFENTHPELNIIETLNESSEKYNIKAYNPKKNTTTLYEITKDSDKLIGVPFLLNEFDADLNVLENTPQPVSIKEYIRRY